MKLKHEQKDVSELIREFRHHIKNSSFSADKLIFKGIDGFDVYNITAPFKANNKEIIAGRVEKRDSEHARVMFFEKESNTCYSLIKNAMSFDLQDPSVSFIGNELVLSGVEIFDHPENKGKLWWRTVFFRGSDIFSLKRFAEGPNGMKDIRLIDLKDKLGVFARPQSPVGKLDSGGGRGSIAYTEIDSLDDLCAEKITNATILKDQILNEQWLGANEIHILKNGILGVLGHVAMYDNNMDRHYYPAAFAFDRNSGTYSNIKVIAERCMFEDGPCKLPDLKDVVFSGGIIRNLEDKSAVLFVGTGDTEAQKIEVEDPFLEHELI